MKNSNNRLAKVQVIILMSVAAMSSTLVSADQNILDDLVVVGSGCFGFDCVNGEVFGFDTIRLKENNLRIKFQDTSSSSSFPTVDWQITANDSSNGGLNHFSIEDLDAGTVPFTILAEAPSNSLYIAPSGNLGLGTATPLVGVHMLSGNTPTVRLEQTNSGGWAAQTWDMGANETNFFIRDVTNNSVLPFRIIPGAPNGSFYIANDGDIGLQTVTPDGLFDVAHSANANNHAFLISPSSDVGINIDNGFSPNGVFDVQTTGGESLFMVTGTGEIGIGVSSVAAGNVLQALSGALLTTGGVWTNASSRALKSDIVVISADVARQTVNALKPVTFTYKSEPDETYAGFIAEDVPEIVASSDRKSLAAMDFVAVLTKLVQEQQKAIIDLQYRVQQLEQHKSAEH
ncbi:MAG: hypothetical protein ACI8Z9_000323 [Paraglaciecola sp.]|jgi:hypothetical protein